MLTVHPVMIARCLVYDDRNTSWLLNKKWVLSLSVCVYASVHAWVHMWVCVCMHAVCVCVTTCMPWHREQLEELSYCHPTNGSLGLNSGHQTWWQVSLCVKPSHQATPKRDFNKESVTKVITHLHVKTKICIFQYTYLKFQFLNL